jgi:hypothetical protein
VKLAACHAFRQFSIRSLREAGYDIRTIQDLLGHTDVASIMICDQYRLHARTWNFYMNPTALRAAGYAGHQAAAYRVPLADYPQ